MLSIIYGILKKKTNKKKIAWKIRKKFIANKRRREKNPREFYYEKSRMHYIRVYTMLKKREKLIIQVNII